jgi:hypothetical protein
MTEQKENQCCMTEAQEKQWRYARALEIAALLIGPDKRVFKKTGVLARYERLAASIMKQMEEHSKPSPSKEVGMFLPTAIRNSIV